jgi:hypothetical protein
MFVLHMTMFVFIYDNVCLHHDNVYLQYDNVRPIHDNVCLQYDNVCLCLVVASSRCGGTVMWRHVHKTSAALQSPPPPQPYPLPYFVCDAACANAQSSTTTLVSGLVPEHAATKKRSDTSRMPPLYDSDNVYDNVCLAYDNVCIYV